jgi:16S rRNA G966 N2-methylase RsmD
MAKAAGCELSADHHNTEVVDMRNPNLSSSERLTLLAEAGVVIPPAASTLVPNKIKNNNDNNNGGMREGGQTTTTVLHVPAKKSLLLRRCDGHVHVGHRTATGPAAGPGAPGTKPRRNYKGILGKFALKNRLDTSKHLTNTAMEPEIAMVMANLGLFYKTTTTATAAVANDKSKSNNHHRPPTSSSTTKNINNIKVLDPCCGSCSLLIGAAACGASTLVGVDLNATAFLGAEMEFQRHGLPQPFLTTGSVLEAHLTPALAANDTYHTILCDPPYGIGAPILDDNNKGAAIAGQGADDKDAGASSTTSNGQRQSQQRQRQQSICEEQDDKQTTGIAPSISKRASSHGAIPDSHHHKNVPPIPPVSADRIVAVVLDIARRTLVVGGRIVLFVPVRGKDATLPLSRVLLDRGCSVEEVEVERAGSQDSPNDAKRSIGSLRLVHGRRQRFWPTFSRWLVVMERVK